MRHRKTLLFSLLLPFLLSGCLPGMKKAPEPSAILTYQKDSYKVLILLRDQKINTTIAPIEPVPYSPNASAAVWVGIHFPYELAIKSIFYARNYYKEIKYFALSDKQGDPPDRIHYQIYIGGSTETALRAGLLAWTDADFKNLRKVRSQEQFHKFIRSKYSNQ